MRVAVIYFWQNSNNLNKLCINWNHLGEKNIIIHLFPVRECVSGAPRPVGQPQTWQPDNLVTRCGIKTEYRHILTIPTLFLNKMWGARKDKGVHYGRQPWERFAICRALIHYVIRAKIRKIINIEACEMAWGQCSSLAYVCLCVCRIIVVHQSRYSSWDFREASNVAKIFYCSMFFFYLLRFQARDGRNWTQNVEVPKMLENTCWINVSN